jgi:hypothetical protein
LQLHELLLAGPSGGSFIEVEDDLATGQLL